MRVETHDWFSADAVLKRCHVRWSKPLFEYIVLCQVHLTAKNITRAYLPTVPSNFCERLLQLGWVSSFSFTSAQLSRRSERLRQINRKKWQLLYVALMLGACSLLRRFIVQVSHNHLFCFLLEVAAKFLCVCMLVFLCLYVRACTNAFAGMLSFHGDHCHHLRVAESPSSSHVKRCATGVQSGSLYST